MGLSEIYALRLRLIKAKIVEPKKVLTKICWSSRELVCTQ